MPGKPFQFGNQSPSAIRQARPMSQACRDCRPANLPALNGDFSTPRGRLVREKYSIIFLGGKRASVRGSRQPGYRLPTMRADILDVCADARARARSLPSARPRIEGAESVGPRLHRPNDRCPGRRTVHSRKPCRGGEAAAGAPMCSSSVYRARRRQPVARRHGAGPGHPCRSASTGSLAFGATYSSTDGGGMEAYWGHPQPVPPGRKAAPSKAPSAAWAKARNPGTLTLAPLGAAAAFRKRRAVARPCLPSSPPGSRSAQRKPRRLPALLGRGRGRHHLTSLPIRRPCPPASMSNMRG